MTTGAFSNAATPASDTSEVSAGRLGVTVHASLSAAAADWHALESRAVLTPYQRFDWIAAYIHAGFERHDTIRVIVVHERGIPVAILPFDIARRHGIVQARIIGMPISNADCLIFDPAYGARLTPELLRSAFSALREDKPGADLVSFHCLPQTWQDQPNPLLGFAHYPAPNRLYLERFEPGDTPFIEQSLPHKRRTNIRRSARRLTEGFGELNLRHATTPEEIDRFHEAFLEQRAARFVTMGVENIFARDSFQSFFKRLALESLDMAKPALRYHALCAGETILATSIGAYTASHYSQYINSTTEGPAAKYSLMGVMLSMLVDELRAEGIVSFDMGLGDFDYKADWTAPVTVYDCLVPVSPLGRLAVPMLNGVRGIKRTIKQTPALWRIARSIQALKTRLSRS